MANIKAIGFLGLIIVYFLFVALFPLALLWSVNTLFLLAIPITFKTYLATLIITSAATAIFGGQHRAK